MGGWNVILSPTLGHHSINSFLIGVDYYFFSFCSAFQYNFVCSRKILTSFVFGVVRSRVLKSTDHKLLSTEQPDISECLVQLTLKEISQVSLSLERQTTSSTAVTRFTVCSSQKRSVRNVNCNCFNKYKMFQRNIINPCQI